MASIHPPSRSLKGKVAIVTGAGCAGDGIGNGRAISILLASDGCDVLCVDLNIEWASKTVEMINSVSGRGRAIAIQADITSATACEGVVNEALQHFGRLDILVNNVGVAGAPGTAVDVDMEQWAKGLEINVSSMVLMAKYAVPAMLKNTGEIKGSIVNMGSVAGIKVFLFLLLFNGEERLKIQQGGTPHLLYPTSKGAVVNMTRAMAAHHGEDGIRVNCVCPGVSVANKIHSLRDYIAYEDYVDALYAYDVCRWHDRRGSRGAKEEEHTGNRRDRVGLRVCSCVSRRRPCKMDHRCCSSCRCRSYCCGWHRSIQECKRPWHCQEHGLVSHRISFIHCFTTAFNMYETNRATTQPEILSCHRTGPLVP